MDERSNASRCNDGSGDEDWSEIAQANSESGMPPREQEKRTKQCRHEMDHRAVPRAIMLLLWSRLVKSFVVVSLIYPPTPPRRASTSASPLL